MTADERRARADWLTELGVPEAFHNAIIDAPTNWMTAAGGAAISIATIVAVVGAVTGAFLWLDGHVQARAAALAAETGATLTYVNVGLGPLIGLFSLIGLVGWAGSVMSARYRVQGFLSMAAGVSKAPPPGLTRRVVKWLVGSSVRRVARGAATVDGFLRAMSQDQARKWGIAGVVLLLPALVLTVLESDSFWVAGPSGIVEHSMIPPFSSRSYGLKEVTGLTTGCNNTDQGNHLIYNLDLGAGGTFSLGSATAVRGNAIAAVEGIDARLGGSVEHRRWSHLNRNPVHPACLGYWASQLDRNGMQRLSKLLRLTPEELRGSR